MIEKGYWELPDMLVIIL